MKTAAIVLTVLWLLCGLAIEFAFAESRTQERIARVRLIGDRNLIQAESKWKACLRNSYFTVDDAIYLCSVQRSELTLGQM